MLSTPTSETLNGGSTMKVPTQTSDANKTDMAQTVLQGKSTGATINSGLTVGSQVAVGPIKPVDSKTLTGSYPGDHRAKAADAVLPSNPGPRDAMGQFPLSSRTPSAPKPFESSTAGSEGDRA